MLNNVVYKLDDNLRDKLRSLYFYIDRIARVTYEFESQQYNLHHGKFTFLGKTPITTSLLILLILNEEKSNCEHRNGIDKLFEQLGIGEDNEKINNMFTFNSISYDFTADMFNNQFPYILNRAYNDYIISMWTSFEVSINYIYERYELENTEMLQKSHFKKFNKFIENIVLNEVDLDDSNKDKIREMINIKSSKYLKEFPKYITSDDKINYIFKLIKSKYSRNINEDKKIIHFLRSLRNTMHNNGIHLANDLEVVIKGEIFEIKKGTAGYFENDMNFVKFYIELLDIYTAIIFALPHGDVE